MLIVITGTPGTGKTSVSRILGGKLGMDVLHLREFVKEKKLASGFDEKKNAEIVDLGKLHGALKKIPMHNIIVEGHLACEIPLAAKFVFVLRCKPTELRKRMEKRRYAKAKIDENLLAEMLDYCTQNAEANYGKAEIFEIETSVKNPEQVAEKVARVVSGKKTKTEKISYAKELKEFLRLR